MIRLHHATRNGGVAGVVVVAAELQRTASGIGRHRAAATDGASECNRDRRQRQRAAASRLEAVQCVTGGAASARAQRETSTSKNLFMRRHLKIGTLIVNENHHRQQVFFLLRFFKKIATGQTTISIFTNQTLCKF